MISANMFILLRPNQASITGNECFTEKPESCAGTKWQNSCIWVQCYQSRYGNIEQKILAVVYEIQYYGAYLYANTYTDVNEHRS